MDQKRLSSIEKASLAFSRSLEQCELCPRACGVNRIKGDHGYCRADASPVIYSFTAHRGEEPPLSGTKGSGTIFFAHCNMKCCYCQNYQFSQLDRGTKITVERLAQMMLKLQRDGCHNINLVNPTHYVPQIVAALSIAVSGGFKLPVIYNTSGYERAETIEALEGIIDIYLPDMRYSDDAMAHRYSDSAAYVENNRAAVKVMQRQVGELSIDSDGIAQKGLIVRLLVLPENISGTLASLRFIRDEVSADTYLSIMSQYYPIYKADGYRELSRSITASEYAIVVDEAQRLGLNNGWIQEAPDPRLLGTFIEPKADI